MHRWFQKWVQGGLFEKLWSMLQSECEELGGVNWQWQSADCSLGKARLGGDKIGRNPTDRGKPGTKKSLLVEAEGGPLASTVDAANVHDTKMLSETLDAIVSDRPLPSENPRQQLCLDKGYDNPTGHQAAEAHDYVPHIRRIGEEKLDEEGHKSHPARRWVVERTLGWLSKCRGILVRYEKKACNYLGMITLACALLWYRRLLRLRF